MWYFLDMCDILLCGTSHLSEPIIDFHLMFSRSLYIHAEKCKFIIIVSLFKTVYSKYWEKNNLVLLGTLKTLGNQWYFY